MTNLGILIGSLRIGGAELQLIQLLENLDVKRFKPLVITLEEKGPLTHRLELKKIEVVSVNLCKKSFVTSIMSLYMILKTRNIDVLYCVLWLPIILGCSVGKIANIGKVVGGLRGLGITWNLYEIWGLRFLGSLADRYIVNSSAVLEAHSKREWIPKRKMIVIPNGLDLKKFSYMQDKNDEIGIVGSLKKIKGQEQFIQAVKLLSGKWSRYRFLIVGDGPDKEALKGLAYRVGVRDKIHFTGNVPDVEEFVRHFKILVSASSSEGLSNVVLEAMSSGTPVVVSDVPSNNEIVKHMHTGLLYRYKDHEDLAAKIDYLLDHGEIYQSIQRNARRYIESHYSIDDMVHRTQSVFLDT